MALSDKKILKHMKKGNIVIDPFRKEHLGTSSYDVCLGEWFYTENRQSFEIYNIWSEKAVKKVWGQPHKAGFARDILRGKNFKFHEGIEPDDKVILIGPGETILAHTEEFIGAVNILTTMMKARSSLGRSFIEVCKCAGWGDVGYVHRWTMEITNNSQHYSIPLVVGRRIAQIVFFKTGKILEKDYTASGKYQTHGDLDLLKKSWSPDSMLPKLYKDREIKKPVKK